MSSLIIDGRNMSYRIGFATKGNPPLALSFLGILRKLCVDYSSKRVVIVWDNGHSKWRRKLYPEYKKRKKNTAVDKELLDGIFSQVHILRQELLPLFPIIQWDKEGYEADDLINAAVKKTIGESVIVSSDRDFYQLLEDNVHIYNFSTTYTCDSFKREYKFHPKLWPKYSALVGDNSDNIKGVTGIGPLKAKQILFHGSLDKFLKEGDNETIKRMVLSQREIYRRNRKLMDFSKFPYSKPLLKQFDAMLRSFRSDSNIEIQEIKRIFRQRKFFDLLKEYPLWIKTFSNMVSQ